jgi:two-component system LytT family response regulator
MSEITLKAIAVDDEQHCLETLIWELSRNCPEVEIIATANDAESAKEIIEMADIDILFMDIHLQSTSGLALVKKLQPLDCQVIFVTAYDQYAIEAFEVEALHYLLKPINRNQLRSAIDRIIDQRKASQKVSIDRILNAMSQTKEHFQRIPFSVQSGIEFVLPGEIIYVKGENNYSVMYFTSGKKLMVSKTLSTVESMLSKYTFLRIHKSYLLNLRHIVRYVKTDGGYIEVLGGDQLSVSRAKRSTINELFQNP